MTDGSSSREARAQEPLARLLRVPLFIKLVVADVAMAVAAVLAGAWLARRTAGLTFDLLGEPALAAAAAVVAVATIAVTGVIVKVALRPIRMLEQTAARVAAGDTSARAPASAVADRDLGRLIETFNNALETAATNRLRLREVAARSVHAAEEERKRIAQELHDGIAQTLAAIRVRMRLARNAKPELQEAEMEAMRESLGTAIEELRAIALGLRPPALDVLGLGPAVEALARSVARDTRLRVDVKADFPERRLEPEAQLTVYRILQEALANVVRHAGADHVRVRLMAKNGNAELTVEDDGRGFVPSEQLGGPGNLGLLGMQERAAYVGGQVHISSRPGVGTRITAEIPIS